MKIINSKFNPLILALTCALACTKKSDNLVPFTAPTGMLEFHIHTYVDTNEVEYDTLYAIGLTGGRKISIKKAQLYISGIQLVKLDGSIYDVANKNLLKVQENEDLLVGNVPVGNYQSVKFHVGLDATTNQMISATLADSVLNKPEMWFGSSVQPDGRISVNFQGNIDTTTAGNGTDLSPFIYKIGTIGNRKLVSMPTYNFTVTANQTQFIHMTIDYAKLFEGIKLNHQNNLTLLTAANNANSLALKLVGNIPKMFRYENSK